MNQIQKDEGQLGLRQLCTKFSDEKDNEAGREAVRYLNRSAEVSSEVAKDCVGIVLDASAGADIAIRDEIFAGLLKESKVARAALARRLLGGGVGSDTTAAFDVIYKIGDGAASGIVAVILDNSAWPTEVARETCEKDVFQLFLAKLLEAGSDGTGRAMRAIARLLAADASTMHNLMDEFTVDTILSMLDYRNATEIRSQATLAIAKYLEASGDIGQATLTKYVTSRVAQQRVIDLVPRVLSCCCRLPSRPGHSICTLSG